jgi:hypothetical protein
MTVSGHIERHRWWTYPNQKAKVGHRRGLHLPLRAQSVFETFESRTNTLTDPVVFT